MRYVAGVATMIAIATFIVVVVLLIQHDTMDDISGAQMLDGHKRIEERVQDRLKVEDKRVQDHLNMIKANTPAPAPIVIPIPAPVVKVVQLQPVPPVTVQRSQPIPPATDYDNPEGADRDPQSGRGQQYATGGQRSETQTRIVVEQREPWTQLLVREGMRAGAQIGAAKAGQPDFDNRRNYYGGGNHGGYNNHEQYLALQRRLQR